MLFWWKELLRLIHGLSLKVGKFLKKIKNENGNWSVNFHKLAKNAGLYFKGSIYISVFAAKNAYNSCPSLDYLGSSDNATSDVMDSLHLRISPLISH
jgi:hypothetical protein